MIPPTQKEVEMERGREREGGREGGRRREQPTSQRKKEANAATSTL